MCERRADEGKKGQQQQMEIMLRFEVGKELTSQCCREWNVFQNLKTNMPE